MNNIKLKNELEVGISAAEMAGEIISKYYNTSFEEWQKRNGDIVTEIDEKSQNKIISRISQEYQSHGFIAEENNMGRPNNDKIWIIDPIDGTFNYFSSYPFFCVSIALKTEGKTTIGIVHSPACSLDKTYFAVSENGAFCKDTGDTINKADKIKTSTKETINNSILTTYLYGDNERVSINQKIISSLVNQGAVQRSLGTGALELCLLAEGSIELFYSPSMELWDYAASHRIVEEANGSFTVNKTPIEDKDNKEIIASNTHLHDSLLKTVKKVSNR